MFSSWWRSGAARQPGLKPTEVSDVTLNRDDMGVKLICSGCERREQRNVGRIIYIRRPGCSNFTLNFDVPVNSTLVLIISANHSARQALVSCFTPMGAFLFFIFSPMRLILRVNLFQKKTFPGIYNFFGLDMGSGLTRFHNNLKFK